jgi:hypothetical protein
MSQDNNRRHFTRATGEPFVRRFAVPELREMAKADPKLKEFLPPTTTGVTIVGRPKQLTKLLIEVYATREQLDALGHRSPG